METNIVYCETEHPNDGRSLPPKEILIENALRGVIHEIADAGCVLIREEDIEKYGLPMKRLNVSLHIVTDRPTMLDIENRLAEARQEGMEAARDIVVKTASKPWESHVGARFGLECAARDIEETVKKQRSGKSE